MYINSTFSGPNRLSRSHFLKANGQTVLTLKDGDHPNELNTLFYTFADHLGSACTLMEAGGHIISREYHTPFGETAYSTPSRARYRYCGKEKDSESGLYYYGARYYSAWTCRFVSVDPLAEEYAQLSSYNYADNSPVTEMDLDGLQGTGTEKSAGSDSTDTAAPTDSSQDNSCNPILPTPKLSTVDSNGVAGAYVMKEVEVTAKRLPKEVATPPLTKKPSKTTPNNILWSFPKPQLLGGPSPYKGLLLPEPPKQSAPKKSTSPSPETMKRVETILGYINQNPRIQYSQNAALNSGSLRYVDTPDAKAYMDCSELVGRTLVDNGDVPSFVIGPVSTVVEQMINNGFKLLPSTDTPQSGDVAVWAGHIGIVHSVNKAGEVRLAHAANKSKGLKLNSYFIPIGDYAKGFKGYYRK